MRPRFALVPAPAFALVLLVRATSAGALPLTLECLPPELGANNVGATVHSQPPVVEGTNECWDQSFAVSGFRDGVFLSASASVTQDASGLHHTMSVDAGTSPDGLVAEAAAESESTFLLPANSSGAVLLELEFSSSGTPEGAAPYSIGIFSYPGTGVPPECAPGPCISVLEIADTSLAQGLNTFMLSLNPGSLYGVVVHGAGIGIGSGLGAATRDLTVRLSTVPEPGTTVLLFLLGLAGWRERRRRVVKS